MNRKKILRNKIARNSKIKVKDVKVLKFRKLHLTYIEEYDTFVCSMIVSINGKLLNIIGYLDPDKYIDGFRIKSPRSVKIPNTNCHELFVSKKDAPVMYEQIIKFINETGDKLDANEYVKHLHGSLDLIDTDVLVDDKYVDKIIQRLSYYD